MGDTEKEMALKIREIRKVQVPFEHKRGTLQPRQEVLGRNPHSPPVMTSELRHAEWKEMDTADAPGRGNVYSLWEVSLRSSVPATPCKHGVCMLGMVVWYSSYPACAGHQCCAKRIAYKDLCDPHSICQVRPLRRGQVKCFAYGHTTGKGGSQKFMCSWLASEPTLPAPTLIPYSTIRWMNQIVSFRSSLYSSSIELRTQIYPRFWNFSDLKSLSSAWVLADMWSPVFPWHSAVASFSDFQSPLTSLCSESMVHHTLPCQLLDLAGKVRWGFFLILFWKQEYHFSPD